MLETNIRKVAPQVQRVYLIDNSTVFRGEAFFESLGIQNLYCIPLGENLGIATALNRGIAAAQRDGMEFVLLLDQDSECASDLIHELLAAHEKVRQQGGRVAAIGSRALDRETGHLSDALRFGWFGTRVQPCPEGSAVPVDFLISSGTLISLETLRTLGTMRENLFIDHVDTEWILRAHQHGYHAYLCCTAKIIHARGERRLRVWTGRWRDAPLHKPFRYYYLFRNYLLLFRQKGLSRKWKFMEVQRLLQMLIFLALFAQERSQIVRFIARGVRDGLRNRGGRMGQ
ncbi:glycosyltransferase family 2 protein [Acidithiobacillus sp. VAN18-1]|uniref:Glycosyltransferase family 2 protein n=1 Tax=Igneacidithiobacillus copahuensis TaxID=2724909 RepID=A0AAE3CIP6_9PROT|nr:glycosyltransferase family 2 protein [Igneacidithiobacillus copahuensis]